MVGRIATALLCAAMALPQAAVAQVSADPAKAPSGIYRLQPSHSQLLFSILHIGLTDYYGRFDRLSGTLNFDSARPENGVVDVTVDVSSIDTASPQLNADLKSSDVFDAEKYPQATFKSVSITRTGATAGKVIGDLTLHGITKRITLDVTFSGGEPDPLGSNYAIGFRATGTIKRTDFGLTGMPWEPMVGDDVTLIIQAMFDQEKEPDMTIANTRTRYGNVAMTLHWLIALMVIGNLCSGLWFGEFMSHNDPLRFTVIQLHKSSGLTILVLSLIRLAWRLVNPVPALPANMGPLMRFLARGTHYLFYFLIIAIPLSGWLLVSASPTGIPTMYFGLFQWPNLPFFNGMLRADKVNYRETFATAHIVMAYLTIALLFLHVAAALFHQFIRRDNVLRRMWFGTDVETVGR